MTPRCPTTAPILRAFSVLFLFLLPAGAATEENTAGSGAKWAQIDRSVVAVRSSKARDAEILLTARKGESFPVERLEPAWVRVSLPLGRSGWLPRPMVRLKETPPLLDPELFGGSIVLAGALGCLAMLTAGVRVFWMRRRRARVIALNLLARTRVQNRIQLLFRSGPKLYSQLLDREVELAARLRELGYEAALEERNERFREACRTFRPHCIVAQGELAPDVEKALEADARLINTPVVYLGKPSKAGTGHNRIRSVMPSRVTDQELNREIQACLRKSPRKIRFSVNKVALAGPLQAGTLSELLQFLAAVAKSGLILVTSQGASGRMVLRKGELIEAAWNGTESVKALNALLNLTEGDFEFRQKRVPADPAMKAMKTESLLLQWAKNKDESNHHIGA